MSILLCLIGAGRKGADATWGEGRDAYVPLCEVAVIVCSALDRTCTSGTGEKFVLLPRSLLPSHVCPHSLSHMYAQAQLSLATATR